MKHHSEHEAFHVTNHIIKEFPNVLRTKKEGEPIEFKFYIAIQALLSLVGEEAVKILLRKNFGYKGLSLYEIVLSALAFLVIAVFEFSIYDANTGSTLTTQLSDLHFYGGLLYLIIACTILFKGLRERSFAKINKPNSYDQGDSDLLKFLEKTEGLSNFQQYVAEPLLFAVLGIAICFYNPIAGIPLIVCAASVYLTIPVRKWMFGDSIEKTVSDLNQNFNSRTINEVS